ncbi:hypothetical protein [Deinococcus sp. Leaf326]|uniref:hypothetical protein n=1 Tax=Deinococcus sp. Leaf326 TaxID=1736338 RepID=UPI0006FA6D68|nr:hypothetical protein [Deinococcus sp. Leaf326]KQR40808.1 hypothetical protein ASF71_01180 [Deinococcus sp. Leaf326]
MPNPTLDLTIRPPAPAELPGVRTFSQGEVRALLLAAFEGKTKVIGSITLQPYDDRLAAVQGCTTWNITPGSDAVPSRRRGVGQALTTEARRAGYTALCLHTHRHLLGGFTFWSHQVFAVRAEDRPNDGLA